MVDLIRTGAERIGSRRRASVPAGPARVLRAVESDAGPESAALPTDARDDALAIALAQTRNAERERLADALHDEVAPMLFMARMALEACQQAAAPTAERLAHANDLLSRSESVVREMLGSLAERTAGFVVELGRLVDTLEARHGVPITPDISSSGDDALASLDPAGIEALLRATQEAVTNAVKHAQPTRVAVTVSAADGWLTLGVVDDGAERTDADGGVGGGYGLASVRRDVRRLGGRLTLTVGPDRGAELSVRLPLAAASTSPEGSAAAMGSRS